MERPHQKWMWEKLNTIYATLSPKKYETNISDVNL